MAAGEWPLPTVGVIPHFLEYQTMKKILVLALFCAAIAAGCNSGSSSAAGGTKASAGR